MNRPNEIPVFFASDDNYIPCLAVAIHSLEKNASKKNNYKLIILHSGMSEKGKQEIKEFEQENIKIEFKDISNIDYYNLSVSEAFELIKDITTRAKELEKYF